MNIPLRVGNPEVICRLPLEPLVQGTRRLTALTGNAVYYCAGRYVDRLPYGTNIALISSHPAKHPQSSQRNSSMQQDSKPAIRHEIRRQRRQLSNQDQVQHAKQLAIFARQIPTLLKAQRVASYRAFAGEIDTRFLEQSLGSEIYLPRITNFRCSQMRFYAQPKRATVSTLGIAEPDGSGPPISLREVDAVLVPLVAFNRTGARLGMGAGFYDRALAFRRWNTAGKRPMLIGLAHHFQERDELQPDPWDVPLDVIITNLEIIFPTNRNKT